MSNSTKPELNEIAEKSKDSRGVERTSELLTLGIDTATNTRSVAVMRGERTLALRTSPLKGAGASTLLNDIDLALSEASCKLSEVELFAVASGPGSFTGLRSGIATVKAFGVAFDVAVLGVPTLHALAYGVGRQGAYAVFIPAGRGEVFAQFLRVDESGDVFEESPAMHIAPERLIEMASGIGFDGEWVAGGGANISSLVLGEKIAGGEASIEAEGVEERMGLRRADGPVCLAEPLARIAQLRYGRGAQAGPEHLKALYVRPSDAELKG